MRITDAAVQAALEYYSEGGCMGLDSYERKEVATAMLEAALPYLQPGFSTKPVDVEAVRRQAFEEAAKALDDLIDYWKLLPAFNRAYAMRSTIKTAADLRALSAEPAQGQWQPTKQRSFLVLKSYVDAGMQLADNLDDISNEILRLPADPTTEAGR